MKSLNLNIGIIALIIIVILSNAIYIVNDKQTAILLRFGEIVEPEINPGLHFKVPIYHTVKKFDSRVLTLDALPQPYFTAEKKRLIVEEKRRVKRSRTPRQETRNYYAGQQTMG